jgi:hypothetical protein
MSTDNSLDTEPNPQKGLSRRGFLKGTVVVGAAAVGSGLLAGCSSKVSPTPTAAATGASGTQPSVMTAELAAKKWSFEIPPDFDS